jgi:TPR repeat protein
MSPLRLWILLFALVVAACNPKDKATQLQEKALQGDAQAAFELGEMHASGVGLPQNNTEAVRWYRIAAEKGNSKAQSLIGTAYHRGIGLAVDDVQATQWLLKAADQMDPLAQFQLGEGFESGWVGQKDNADAYKWYLLSASQGYTKATIKVTAIENILNKTQRIDGQTRASEFRAERVKKESEPNDTLIKSAQKGDPEAQYKLGAAYSFGKGLPKNDIKSVEWLTRAANQGQSEAQFELGLHYLNGEGVESSEVEAYQWWSIAAGKGHIRAQASLDNLEKKISPTQKSEATQKASTFSPVLESK